ncbi:MAG: nucleotidyl transferase AbiEii/AbiGii toxin family protein [Thermomicrobiales bacterium]
MTRYATEAAFRTALEARIAMIAKGDPSRSIPRLRKMVVFDRLLARLLIVAPEGWSLKGGVALEFRLGSRARVTADLDLSATSGGAPSLQDFLLAADLDVGDFFRFSISQDKRAGEDSSVRYHVDATIAGRRFESVALDVGATESLDGRDELITGTDLLGFAGMAPIRVPILPLEQHVAEKLHAYTRKYSGGRMSSRVKDLIDIVLIQGSFSMSAGALRRSLETTFDQRATHATPKNLPVPPSDWEEPYKVLAEQVGLEPNLSDGFRVAADFLDPVLGGGGRPRSGDRWDPRQGIWVETPEGSGAGDQGEVTSIAGSRR